MEPLVLTFAVFAGIAIGSEVTMIVMRKEVNHLVDEILLMKREGFVSYPKVLRPPTDDPLDYRED